MEQVVFDRLREADRDGIRRMAAIHAGLPAQWGEACPVAEEDIEAFADQLEAGIRGGRVFCETAECGGSVVSFLWAEALEDALDVANIISLWTAPEHRRRGVATDLKKRMEGWARLRGIKRILTGVDPRNTAVVKMNEKLGYRTALLKMEKLLS
jgi:GNAT superfamily N-acetyltransferase